MKNKHVGQYFPFFRKKSPAKLLFWTNETHSDWDLVSAPLLYSGNPHGIVFVSSSVSTISLI